MISNWKTYRQREERLSKHPGTCEWIFEHEKFKEWCQFDTFEARTSILFVIGPSGCGKSVLANHIFNTLKEGYDFWRNPPESSTSASRPSSSNKATNHTEGVRPIVTILRFFCRDARNSTFEAGMTSPMDSENTLGAKTPIVEAFLHQILDQRRPLFRSISAYFYRQPLNFGIVEIQEMFRQVLSNPEIGHIILIIDGLDECEDSFIKEFLDYTDFLIRDTPSRTKSNTPNLLKILLTCQPIGPIPFFSCCYSSIHIQLQDISQDMSTLIKDEVSDIARSRSFDADLKQLAEDVLLELAGRMFLWAFFMLQELRHLPVISHAAIVSKITSFPRDLDLYYERTLSRIIERSRSNLSRERDSAMILLVVVFSFGDISTTEVAEILAIADDRPSRDAMVDFINTDLRTLAETQLGPFLALEDDFLSVSHYSIYEYFKKIGPTGLCVDGLDITFDSKDRNGHLIMAELCLRYLLLDDFSRLPRPSFYNLKLLYKRFPLLRYASNSWFGHIRLAGNKLERVLPLIRLFLDTQSANYRFWDNIVCVSNGVKTTGPPAPVLCTLVHRNLFTLHEIMREQNPDNEYTLARFSSYQESFCRWFRARPKVDHPVPGAEELNERDRNGFTAFHIAIILGHSHWLKFLIHIGTDLSARTPDGFSALHLAADASSDITCAEILLKDEYGLGIDDEALNDDKTTPLCVAVSSGHTSIASLLLQHSASVDLNRPAESQPLFLAADAGHEDTVLLLLEYNPTLALRAADGRTLLHLAAYHGMTKLAMHLAANLVTFNVDDRTEEGYRPLQIAAEFGSKEMIKFLITHGALIEAESDIVLQSSDHKTAERTINISPLALAVRNDKTSNALFLLDKGANWQLESWSDWTLLHEAARADNLQILKRLQLQGMDINRSTSNGETPLWLATIHEDDLMVNYILSLSPDLNPPLSDTGMTPLHMAAYLGASAIVETLLVHGADVNAKTKDGISVAYAAVLGCNHDALRIIIRYNPDMNFPDNSGETPLLYAVRQKAVECVSVLLNAGASTACRIHTQRQPLHAAAARGHLSIVRLLLTASADIDARDRSGYNSFMIACEVGCEKIMDELLERGADLTQCTTVDGRGLFHLAALSRKILILEKVIQLIGFAEIDRPSTRGVTPFHIAFKDAGIDFMQKLLLHGADVHRLTNLGENAIHFACFTGELAKVRYLLSLRISFMMRDEGDNSPLEVACAFGHVEVAEALLARGADFRHINRLEGQTCLHFSARWGRDDIISLLIARHADLEARDLHSRTPLHGAIISFKRSATNLLIAAGANINAADGLGRTAFDLVMQHYHDMIRVSVTSLLSPAIRDLILTNIEGGHRDDTTSRVCLQKLARSLLRLQDHPNALRAYSTTIVLPDPAPTSITDATEHTQVIHYSICDNCQDGNVIVGARYVCQVCEDIDLCASCKELYDDSETGPYVCRNHTFFKVPETSPYMAAMVFEKEKFHAEKTIWLDELYTKYSTMECSSPEENAHGRMTEIADPTLAIWTLRLCGLDVFNIRAVWALRRASPKQN